jgi:hypothetical protein
MEYTFKVIDPAYGKFYGTLVTAYMKISEFDDFLKRHPHLEVYIDTAPAVMYNGKHFGSLENRMPSGFKDVLQKLGEANPATELGDRYRKNKTIKEIKTRDIVRDYSKKMAKKGKKQA